MLKQNQYFAIYFQNVTVALTMYDGRTTTHSRQSSNQFKNLVFPIRIPLCTHNFFMLSLTKKRRQNQGKSIRPATQKKKKNWNGKDLYQIL
jgi:hypothetical protein